MIITFPNTYFVRYNHNLWDKYNSAGPSFNTSTEVLLAKAFNPQLLQSCTGKFPGVNVCNCVSVIRAFLSKKRGWLLSLNDIDIRD